MQKAKERHNKPELRDVKGLHVECLLQLPATEDDNRVPVVKHPLVSYDLFQNVQNLYM
jgi:hypothetical protein